uniref:RING-type domain-containing protein n=1 Tax=Aplanochytrium stocchinoi TaxID=215587 RepID=A0A7S3LLZ9_9STRA
MGDDKNKDKDVDVIDVDIVGCQLQCAKFEFSQNTVYMTLELQDCKKEKEELTVNIYLISIKHRAHKVVVSREHIWLFFDDPNIVDQYRMDRISDSKSNKFSGSFVLRNRVSAKDEFFIIFSAAKFRCRPAISPMFYLDEGGHGKVSGKPLHVKELVLSNAHWSPPTSSNDMNEPIDLTEEPAPTNNIVSLCEEKDKLFEKCRILESENSELKKEVKETKTKVRKELALQSQKCKNLEALLGSVRKLKEIEIRKLHKSTQEQGVRIRSLTNMTERMQYVVNTCAADIDALEDELSCSICFELFDDPVVLKCAHTFCSKCWENEKRTFSCRKRKHGHKGRVFHECPTCRSKISNNKPYRSVATEKIVEAFKKLRSKTGNDASRGSFLTLEAKSDHTKIN